VNETMEEFYIRLYPQGTYTCDRCKCKNKAGESFRYRAFSHYCNHCFEIKDRAERAEKREEISSGERDTDCEDEITCPYCGYELQDSYEYLEGSNEELGEIDCPECDESFSCTASFSVSYSTQRIEKKGESFT
jgi:hypothetical protein